MPYGYAGRILHVNLSEGSLTIEEPDERFYRTYMGGSALAMHYILRDVPAGADPLGPENVLVVSVGVLTGAPISGQSRVMVNAKSPLTGAIGDAQGGGFWPAELKRAGFDAIVVRGQSPKPVYLWLHDGQAELRDASHLWGKITGEAEQAIREELGDPKVEVLQIGPAGEKLVRYAAVMNMSNRAAGRTGMGAVMGSKKLKAIAVRGTGRPEIHDRQALSQLARWGAENVDIIGNTALHGTAFGVPDQQEAGGLPTRNWSSGVFEHYEALSGETMSRTILKERDTCYGCAVRCKRVVEVHEDRWDVDPHYGGPEYETIATLGSYCGIGDLSAVAKGNELCNKYGLDTISAGATIAFAMDCFENGILTTADTGGIELRFGNAEAMVQLLEMIGKREGIGDLLAEGSARAAEKLGRGAERYVVAVKKQELPAHMPEVKRSLATIYSVNPFGADHMSHEHDPSYEPSAAPMKLERLASLDLLTPEDALVLDQGKVRFAYYTECFYSLLDTVGTCQFVWGPGWQIYGPSQLVEAMRAVTGWDVTLFELMKVGERRLHMMRAFNTREGLTRKDDWLPRRCFEPKKGGASDGYAITQEELSRSLDWYYQMAGLDEEGRSTRAKLMELDLEWVADILP
ncbi:MAG: aldehyde ferredoxin oxidoreductase family protein [Anaerolineae bacterium]|nr:aldehyde ferredoxin oxidoreductase family protein [Anaerolineae bacterium]